MNKSSGDSLITLPANQMFDNSTTGNNISPKMLKFW